MARELVWSFETARYAVRAYVEPEEIDPADSFEFPEDIAAVRNGDVAWFAVTVEVVQLRFGKTKGGRYARDGAVLGWDNLGGCAYASTAEFFHGHRDPDPLNRNCEAMRVARGGSPDAKVSVCHYFPSMVREAIANARERLESSAAKTTLTRS